MAEEIVFALENDADAGRRRSESLDIRETAAAMPRRRGSGSNLAAVKGHCNGTNGYTNGYSAQHSEPRAKDGVEWDGSRLYWFDEAPPVLQFNKFVHSGYRAGMTHCQCLYSILQYHNETGNILSHLLPALLLAGALLTGMLPSWPGYPAAFFANTLPILLCLSGSVVYHTFMADHHNYRAWITLDVCGIFVLFLGGVHVVLWWGMRCWPTTRALYTGLYYAVAAGAVVAATQARSVVWRALPMLVLFLVRVGVTVMRAVLGAGSPLATKYYAAMEVLSFVGAVVNVARVPERWFQPAPGKPGFFDVWFNSHMVMHVVVVVAMGLLHRGCTLDYLEFISNPHCAS
mmetsp:Transcript_18221/g.54829  ORF Transcript_18221/g.54829 Transcript_18221/m.54829 type:complete len:345 (-) Transcript_18221:1785-2819(-)